MLNASTQFRSEKVLLMGSEEIHRGRGLEGSKVGDIDDDPGVGQRRIDALARHGADAGGWGCGHGVVTSAPQ
jgi:hypothetical protein